MTNGPPWDPEEYAQKCAADPLFFMESALRIVPKEGGRLIPFRLNHEQEQLITLIQTKWQANEPVRLILLKARQLGGSTFFEALIYWMTSTKPNTFGMVLAHNKESAQKLLQMSTRFALNDARHSVGCMPQMSHVNRNELMFNNPDWKSRITSPGLDSHMHVGTAENKDVGHSETLQAFHGSEVSRWPYPEALIGIMEAMPNSPGTFAALESTANGASGVFYDKWQGAVAGENEWTPVFLSWKGRPEYRIPMTERQKARFQPTPKEEKLMEIHGLALEEILWRRVKIKSFEGQGRDAEDIFREQYPLTPEEAFVGSGRQYFDLAVVAANQHTSREKAFVDGVLVGPQAFKIRDAPPRIEFVRSNAGHFRVWKMPEKDHDYCIGADVAAGVRGGNFSQAYVMDRTSQEVVARYRALIDPALYTVELVKFAWFYNRAILAPEANSIGMLVARDCSHAYARCVYFVDLREGEYGEPDPAKPGWYTTAQNRKEMLGRLRHEYKTGLFKTWDLDFHEEATHFVIPLGPDGLPKEDRPRAAAGKTDDCIMAGAITLWVNDWRISGPIRRPKASEAPPKDWLEAAMRAEVNAESEPKPKYVDEHLGTSW